MMQKRTDFPSKNEFSISRVSFQMTCFFILSLLLALAVHVNISDRKYWLCRWWTGKIIADSKEKKSTINDIIQRKIIALILQIFLFSQMKCAFAHPPNAVNCRLGCELFSQLMFFHNTSTFQARYFPSLLSFFFCVLFHDKLQDENVCEKTHLVFISRNEAVRELSNTIKSPFRQLIVSIEIIFFVRTIRDSRRSFSGWMLRWS